MPVSKRTGASLHKTNSRAKVSYPRGRTGNEWVVPTFETSSRGKTVAVKGKKQRYTHARRGRSVYSK